MTQVELEAHQADGNDAQAMQVFMKAISEETSFVILSDELLNCSSLALANQLDKELEFDNTLTLVAYLGDEMVAMCRIQGGREDWNHHIGDLFIAVKKDYWQHGLASWLLAEALEWAETVAPLLRVELTVQTRNEKAIQLYKKFGFATEGTKIQGAKIRNGEYLDLYYMGKILDKE